jgi:hypothetical protein
MSAPGPSLPTSAEAFAVGLLSLALVPAPAPASAPVLRQRAFAIDTIRRDTGAGWDVLYAPLQPLPSGGRPVVFATERPWAFFEPDGAASTRKYEYLIGEIRVGADGIGERQLAESGEPVRLSQVVVEGATPPRP